MHMLAPAKSFRTTVFEGKYCAGISNTLGVADYLSSDPSLLKFSPSSGQLLYVDGFV